MNSSLNRRFGFVPMVLSAMLTIVACDDKSDAKDTKDAKGATAAKAEDSDKGKPEAKKAEEPKAEASPLEPLSGLMLTRDSAACKKALRCCEEGVKLETGKLDGGDVNLKCSGVAMQDSDEKCEEFKKGYLYTFEQKKAELPEACK